MREIILDTETTGLDPQTGDRLVEIGCLELLNSIPTGAVFHQYLDPQRDVPEEAFRVHGLSREFLTGKPLFEDVVADFLAFIGEDTLVIHNAEFDMRFINAELARIGRAPLSMSRVVDTLALARKKHPGASNSLDALCARYKIDNSRRTKHGALLDSEILADVYAELTGGRQTALVLQTAVVKQVVEEIRVSVGPRPDPLPSSLNDAEAAAHATLVAQMGDKALWNHYLSKD
jgi:DNA polymerase-3 subunit epsilon